MVERKGICSASAGAAELYRVREKYVIVRPNTGREGGFIHMEHHDLAFLERVSTSMDGPITWEPSSP